MRLEIYGRVILRDVMGLQADWMNELNGSRYKWCSNKAMWRTRWPAHNTI
jgi:hypothetical protein